MAYPLTISARDKAIDVAKGWGILCIVFLHYENGVIPPEVNTYIGLFMISIFYITAGWVTALKPAVPTRRLIERRLRSLIVPYLLWSLIIIAFDGILWLFDYYDNRFMAREIYKTLTLRGIGTLWFLPALFIGEVVWNFCRRHHWILTLCLIALALYYGHWYWGYFADKTGDPWMIVNAPFRSANNACTAFVDVVCGFGASRLYHSLKVHRGWLDGIAGAVMCAAGWAFMILGWPSGVWRLLFFPLSVSVVTPVGFILIFKGIGTNRIGEWLLRYFNFWGRNSLSLMVTHYSFVMVIVVMLFEQYTGHKPDGWFTIFAFLAMMPVQYLIARLLNRHAHPALLGQSLRKDTPRNE